MRARARARECVREREREKSSCYAEQLEEEEFVKGRGS